MLSHHLFTTPFFACMLSFTYNLSTIYYISIRFILHSLTTSYTSTPSILIFIDTSTPSILIFMPAPIFVTTGRQGLSAKVLIAMCVPATLFDMRRLCIGTGVMLFMCGQVVGWVIDWGWCSVGLMLDTSWWLFDGVWVILWTEGADGLIKEYLR